VNVPPDLVAAAVSLLLLAASVFAGTKYVKVRRKLQKLAELLNTINEALQDETVTAEEVAEIVKDAQELIADP